jgi:hypothetical protein
VHTTPLTLPNKPIFKNRYAALLLGAPAVADLNGDGWAEVSVADTSGFLHVWTHDGKAVPGFPVRGNPNFSEEPGCQTGGAPACDDYRVADVRDEINTVYRAFTAMPSVGDLDPDTPGLELVAGSNDGHVYVWHDDGKPMAGWPVLLRDPAKVAAVDPVTHKVTFTDDAGVHFGRKIISTPSIADVDGDGTLEVAVNVNEEYEEPPNLSAAREPSLSVIAQVKAPGNTRVYLLHADGAAHPATPEQAATPNPDDQAYVAGWPVPIALLTLELLPYVGEGSNAAPVLADVDGDGKPEIGTGSIAGPPYLLKGDGTSAFGNGPDGKPLPFASNLAEFKNPLATDGPTIASLGGGAFGRMGGPSSSLSFVMGSTGLRRLLDVVLPEQQLLTEDHISAWDTTLGSFQPGFPAAMNDLMFFNTPAVADVDGDGHAEVLQGSAMYDLRAYSAGGTAPTGWPKFTGGWTVVTPAVGDIDGDGKLEVAAPTREGNLFVFETQGEACQVPEWPKYQHDLWNTGSYGTDASRPGRVTDVHLDGSTLRFTSSGGDGRCGTADSFLVTVNGQAVEISLDPQAAGTEQSIGLPGVGPGSTVTIQAVDAAGNVSPPVEVRAAGAVRPAVEPAPIGVLPTTGGSGPFADAGVIALGLALLARAVGRRRSSTIW